MSLTITTADGITSTAANPATVNLYAGQSLNLDGVSYAGALQDVPNPQSAKFRWDFGNPGSKYDHLPGFNAGHVYDVAGNYVVTLTVMQPSSVSTATLNVNVGQNPNQQPWNGTSGTIYVAAAGTSSNSGADPTHPVDVATAASRLANAAQNVRILFNRGDRFPLFPYSGTNAGFILYHPGPNTGDTNVTFGAYGQSSLPLPVLDMTNLPSNGAAIGNGILPTRASQIVIQDVRFDDNAAVNAVVGLYTNDITMRRCQAGYVHWFANISSSVISGALVEDCSNDGNPSGGTYEMEGNFVYYSGQDTSIIGNTARGDQQENTIRGDGNFSRALVYGNESWGPVAIAKTAIDFRNGQYAYCANNIVHPSSAGGGSMGITPTVPGQDLQYVIAEDNYFDVGSILQLTSGVSHAAAQNNVFYQGAGRPAIVVGHDANNSYSNVTDPEVDIRIANNTVYAPNSPSGASFLGVLGDPYDQSGHATPQLTLQNNLYVLPTAGTGALDVDAHGAAGGIANFAAVSNNVWQQLPGGTDFNISGTAETVPTWNTQTGANDFEQSTNPVNQWQRAQVSLDTVAFNDSPTHFTPISVFASEIAPAPYTGFEDFYGNARPATGTTVGAVQVPPSAPTALGAMSETNAVALMWDPAPSNDGNTNVTGWNIYRSTSSSGPFSQLNGSLVTTNSYTDSSAAVGSTYYYQVKAVDTGGSISAPAQVGPVGPNGTVSVARVGIWDPGASSFYLDTDGNHVAFDGGDTTVNYPNSSTYLPVTGDWSGAGHGKYTGVFNPATATWYLDSNENNVPLESGDSVFQFGNANDVPVVGDWNGNGRSKIGVWRPSDHTFSLDTNGDGTWNGGDTWFQLTNLPFNASDTYYPVAGDWNGNGKSQVGFFDSTTGMWYLDQNEPTDPTHVFNAYAFGNPGDLPVVGSWNGGAKDEIGVWRASDSSFSLDTNGDYTWGTGDTWFQGWEKASSDKPVSI